MYIPLASLGHDRDVIVPKYMANFMNLHTSGLTIRSNHPGKAEFNKNEMVVCMVNGAERIRMVSAIYKPNMYSGVFEGIDPIETPVNLFEKDPA